MKAKTYNFRAFLLFCLGKGLTWASVGFQQPRLYQEGHSYMLHQAGLKPP